MTGKSRAITMDPLLDREPLLVQPVRVESIIPAGFRQVWLTGENDAVEIELASTAGLGGKWMTLLVKDKVTGARMEEAIDMSVVLQDWVDAALAAGPSPMWSDEAQAFVPVEEVIG